MSKHNISSSSGGYFPIILAMAMAMAVSDEASGEVLMDVAEPRGELRALRIASLVANGALPSWICIDIGMLEATSGKINSSAHSPDA